MEKVAIRVAGNRAFFDDVAREAARLDRSPSWLLARCLSSTLPKLADTVAVAAAATVSEPAPKSRRVWTFFVPRDIVEHCARLAVRLRISSDDVVAWAWQAGREDAVAAA